MTTRRILAASVASLGVAGCAVVALRMNAAAQDDVATPAAHSTVAARPVARPAFLPMRTAAAPQVHPTSTSGSVSVAAAATSTTPGPTSTPTSSPTPAATPSSTARAASHAVAAPSTSAAAARTSASPRPAATSAPVGQALPLRFSTGSATRVITVTAHSTTNTTATLQAWSKVAAGGWRKYGSAVTAHVGADGLSTHPSETRSATPIGSFTLTQAFGRYTDPGTALPYIHTRPSDWWISQAGPLYNTHQRCSSSCAFRLGSPNEHLYYETPYYNYAVVIDYNTRNAPGGVRQGAGSAFFLHVTDGYATAGCVAISQSKLVTLMRWLMPSAHPRILIGIH